MGEKWGRREKIAAAEAASPEHRLRVQEQVHCCLQGWVVRAVNLIEGSAEAMSETVSFSRREFEE